MTDKQSLWRNQNVAPSCRAAYDKAMTGRKPLAAIRAKCHDCQNWQLSEIKGCAIEQCPLWPYRMGRRVPLPEANGAKAPRVYVGRFKRKPVEGTLIPPETVTKAKT